MTTKSKDKNKLKTGRDTLVASAAGAVPNSIPESLALRIKNQIIIDGCLIFGEFAEGDLFEDFAETLGSKIAGWCEEGKE